MSFCLSHVDLHSIQCQSLLSAHRYFVLIHSVLQNFELLSLLYCICSVTLLFYKIVSKIFPLKFNWLVLTGERFSQPCRCFVIYFYNIFIFHKNLKFTVCLQQVFRASKHNSKVFRPKYT